MARPREIDWGARMSIFLSYRRKGKVYPVAKAHSIARSTATLVINEFLESGFARKPRPSLSPSTLALAQEQHLKKVIEEVPTAHTIHLLDPGANLRAGLDPEVAIKAHWAIGEADPIPLTKAMTWHLKGTTAEGLIQEVRKAVRDYDEQCLTLWRDLKTDLYEISGIPVRPFPDPSGEDKGPCFIHELVDRAYEALFGRSSRLSEHPPPNWKSEGSQLWAGSLMVAIGEPGQHEVLRQGASNFLNEKLEEHRQQADALVRLHHDLQYVEDIVREALDKVTEQDVRRGICPECPYPEVLEESLAVRAPRKPRKGGNDEHG